MQVYYSWFGNFRQYSFDIHILHSKLSRRSDFNVTPTADHVYSICWQKLFQAAITAASNDVATI